jgi:serine/threonine protein kinase/tetratricopeptide (TPR) repeat protein
MPHPDQLADEGKSAEAGVSGPHRSTAGSPSVSVEAADGSLDLDHLDPALLEMVEVFTERTLAGETVDVDQLVAGHPDWADAFRRLLPTLRGLAALDPAAGGADRPGDSGPEEGKVFGDFRIVREIGRGGMGVVYEAVQLAIGRRVALKVLSMAAALDSRALKRFQLEAQVAGLLQHPRIVPVHAVGVVDKVPYIALQYVEGGSLSGLIAELRGLIEHGGGREPGGTSSDSPSALALGLLTGRFAPGGRESESGPHDPISYQPGVKAPQSIRGRAYLHTVARLGIQAAEALAYAHEQGIVHRDVKPANLLLDRRGDLWVADFGMADVQGDAGLTMTGDLPGTLRYMSPEQAAGRRALVDRRTDVYSLGATLYELLTLQPAVVGADRAEIIRRISEQEPEPIRRLNPAVPVDLATIVTKALSKEPSKRYETAQQLGDDLGRFLEGRPIAARPVGPVARTWRWCRRKPVPASLAAALVLALIVGFTGITWNWWKAQSAERRALREAANARAAEQEARTQSAKADAINRFLIDKLLGQASPSKNPGSRTLTLREALDRAAADVGQSFKEQPEIEAAIRMAVGGVYHDLGDYPKSEAHYRAAQRIHRDHPGGPAEAELEAMTELGHLLRHLGRLEEAEVVALEAAAKTKQALGPGHPVKLRALNSLADLYEKQGRADEAEALYRSVIKESGLDAGQKVPAALDAMSNLGALLRQRKRYEEAEQLLRKSGSLQVEVRGPDHPSAVTTLEGLALLLYETGRLDEA